MSEAAPGPVPATGKKPVVKVAAAGGGGAVATIVIAIVQGLGGDVSPEVAAAIATVCSFAAGYITPPR
jgi:putative flippase GtrA